MPFGQDTSYPLDGESGTIHALNENLGLTLTHDTVIGYLVFFSASLWSAQGRFLIVESADALDWVESPDASVLAELNAMIEPPRVVKAPDNDAAGQFIVNARMVYGTSLFMARFVINQANGEVIMEDDEPLAGNLELVDDTSRLPYIGDFDAEGQFEAYRGVND